MTDTLLEQIKADRESGTPRRFIHLFGDAITYTRDSNDGCRNKPLIRAIGANQWDMCRFARVPDLEAAYIALTEARARDAEAIKAAEEIIDDVAKRLSVAEDADTPEACEDVLYGMMRDLPAKIAAFRAAQEKNDG